MSNIDLTIGNKTEKKEVKKMKKLGMNNVNKETLLEILTGKDLELNIPKKVTVRSFNTGQIDRSNQEPLLWASIEVSDSEELQALSSMGYEDNVGIIKLKIANYLGEQLDYLVGKELETKDLDVVFDEKKTNRGTDIQGLAFRTELKNVKVVG